MTLGAAWTLNLDADLELERGVGYAPRGAIVAAIAQTREPLAKALLGADDLLIDETSPAGCARGLSGRAFCPTPRALAALTRTGAVPEPHPSFEVLRRVNSRAFAMSLGATLPDAEVVTTEARARELLSRPPSVSRGWRLKSLFGLAGRGQRSLACGALSPHDAGFLATCLSRHGAVVREPEVELVAEWAIHGLLAATGELAHGAVVRQRCDRRGRWLSTEPVDEHALDRGVRSALLAEVAHVGAALHRAGYFGPFGVDAFSYRVSGGEALQPRSEINARYSMGWPVGMRGFRAQ